MRRLVARGLAVIFITHKLKEAFAYGDRITILRLGRKVGEIAPERLRAMDEARGDRRDRAADVRSVPPGGVERAGRACAPRRRASRHGAARCWRSADLDVHDPHTEVAGSSFAVAAGEILGIAGIDGNGQKQLAEALAGQRPAPPGASCSRARRSSGSMSARGGGSACAT